MINLWYFSIFVDGFSGNFIDEFIASGDLLDLLSKI